MTASYRTYQTSSGERIRVGASSGITFTDRRERAAALSFQRAQRRRRLLHGALLLAAVVGITVTLMAAFLSTADGETNKKKTVTSVCIQDGDSLWSIANEYYTKECGDFRDYVKEIRRTNNLDGDFLQEGAYLLIPYYEDPTLDSIAGADLR